jgi:hypothetical protein
MHKLFISLSIMLLISGCQKKVALPIPDQISRQTMVAKVNGQNWSMIKPQISRYGQGYEFAGHTKSGALIQANSIFLDFTYTIGTVPLSQSGSFQATYWDENGETYPVDTGMIDIIRLNPTSDSTIINRLRATFSFTTLNVSGKTFSITDGFVDFER